MRIAYTNAEQTRIREEAPYTRWCLAMHKPRVLCAVELSEVTSAVILTYGDILQGALPDEQDYTMLVGSSIGDDSKGVARAYRFEDGSTIRIGETAANTSGWAPGDVLTIIEEHRLWARHIQFNNVGDGTIDGDAVGQRTSELQPQPVVGPPAVGYVDEPIQFYGEFSRTWTDGATIDVAQWEMPDGTLIDGLGTVATPHEWTPAQAYPDGRYVYLTVVDSNGQQNTTSRLVFVFERSGAVDRPRPDVAFAPIRGDVRSGGYETSVTVYDETDWDVYEPIGGLTHPYVPGGRQVVIFQETTWPDGSTDNIGGNWPYRENVLFWGWVLDEELRPGPGNGGRPSVELRLGSHHKILEQIQSYPVAVENKSSPASWLEMVTPTANRVLHLLANWRSTLQVVADWFGEPGYGESEVAQYYDLDPGTLWAQLRSIYAGASFEPLALTAFDMQGAFHADLDANVLAASERSSYVQGAALTDADRRLALRIQRRWTLPTAQVVLWGVDYDIPLGSTAPDNPMAQGAGLVEHSRMIAPSQETLNVWSGNLLAKLNAPYPEITIPTRGYRLDFAPQSKVSLTFSSTQMGNRLTLNNTTAWVRGFTLNPPQQGLVLSEVVVELDTSGLPGATIPLPTDLPPPPIDPPPPPIDPPPPPPNPPQGWLNCWVCSTTGLWAVLDIPAPPSTDQPIIYEASGGFTDFSAFAVDPFDTDVQFCHYGAVRGINVEVDFWFRSGHVDGHIDPWDRPWYKMLDKTDLRDKVRETIYPNDPVRQAQVVITHVTGLQLDINNPGVFYFTISAFRAIGPGFWIYLAQATIAGSGMLSVPKANIQLVPIVTVGFSGGEAYGLACGAFNGDRTSAFNNRIIASGGNTGSQGNPAWRHGIFRKTNSGPQEFTPAKRLTYPSGENYIQLYTPFIDPNDTRVVYYWSAAGTAETPTLPASFIRVDYRADENNPQYILETNVDHIPAHPSTLASPPGESPHMFASMMHGMVAGWLPTANTTANAIRFFSHNNNKFVRGLVDGDNNTITWDVTAPQGDIAINTPTGGRQCWGIAWSQGAQTKLYVGKMWNGENRLNGTVPNPPRSTVFCIALDSGVGDVTFYDRGGNATIQGKIIAIVPDWGGNLEPV